VVSLPPGDNERALFIVMAHTTSIWRTQYEVVISHPALVQGVFDAQQTFFLPPVKFDRKLGYLTTAQMTAVEAAMATILGLKLATARTD
jgi:mRNA-degrading endonuclease toxin of MazEF toxin-antitoxin module